MSEDQVVARPAAKQPVITTVTMDDGRIVDFAGKRKMLKESSVVHGVAQVRLDFVNGESRIYKCVQTLQERFICHGIEQKLGDEIAGVEEVEDCVEAIDSLLSRLEKGEWTVTREKGSGLAGSSILVRALVELTGKPVQQIRDAMATKTQEEKMALRRNKSLAPIVAKLEAAKAAGKEKKSGVDSDAILDELTAPPVVSHAHTPAHEHHAA